MGNLEKPLTWGLVIVLLGYLFVANCECGEDATCTLNNGFNIGFEDGATEVNKEIRVEVHVEGELINNLQDTVLEDIDMEGDSDTLIEINIDLTEEEEEIMTI